MFRKICQGADRFIVHLILFLSFVLWTITADGQSANGTWDPQFTLPPGINGPVYAIATSGNSLYVGGAFSKAGGVAANSIAKWDGTNWSAVGSGVVGQVNALAVSGTNLYVGGEFHVAGGIGATNIAKWNGTNWQALGAGVDKAFLTSPPGVYTLYANGTDLYVGGQFELAGGQPAINVAHWDGSAWHAMDTGAYLPDDPEPSGSVQAITGDGTNVYIGGSFVQAGSVAVTNLARWDGNAWQAMGNCTGGLPGYLYQGNLLYGSVSALAMHQGSLFIGGGFGYVGGIFAEGFARWDGTNWHNVGNVLGGPVKALESYAGSLYLAGSFTLAGGVATTNAAVWTSGTWSAMNADLHAFDFVYSVQHFGSQPYLGGVFSWLHGVSAGNLGRWDGTNWLALGSGTASSLGGAVYALATDGTNVYATGYFGTAGTNAVTGVAKWDGTNWSAVGLLPPTEGLVMGNSLAVVGSNIFVGGFFTIPEAGAKNLAFWNGTAWHSPGGPLTNVFVDVLLTVGNVLYESGSFTDASARQIGPVAAWDGTNWNNVPWSVNSEEDKLATDQTNLYIAKSYFTNNDYAVQVARWDGTNVSFVGGGFANTRASALAASGTNLYLAISQTTNNYAPALYSWNGNAWQSMGAPLAYNGFIAAILPLRGNLYLAGNFTSLNGTPANCIARWTGTTWQSLGSGVAFGPSGASLATIESMVALGRKVFVGGQFTSAGSLDAGNFATWNEAPEIRLANPRKGPDGNFTFDLSGVPGDQLEIQTSTTLTNWTPLASTNLVGEILPFSDSTSTNAAPRYYRVRFIK
ncbi:MAG: hypothetical protein JWQ04_279 [Pedosphaera sp.]|nr:hypothetical protein [Pedosphaera sp.]